MEQFICFNIIDRIYIEESGRQVRHQRHLPRSRIRHQDPTCSTLLNRLNQFLNQVRGNLDMLDELLPSTIAVDDDESCTKEILCEHQTV